MTHRLPMSSLFPYATLFRSLVMQARETGRVAWRQAESAQGVQILAAVPHPDGQVTTIVVAPQSRLVDEDPFSLLSGLSRPRSEEHTSELQSRLHLVCRLLLE